jgi:hypothetical protein
MKISLVLTVVFYAGRRTDVTKLIAASRDFTNVPKKTLVVALLSRKASAGGSSQFIVA